MLHANLYIHHLTCNMYVFDYVLICRCMMCFFNNPFFVVILFLFFSFHFISFVQAVREELARRYILHPGVVHTAQTSSCGTKKWLIGVGKDTEKDKVRINMHNIGH